MTKHHFSIQEGLNFGWAKTKQHAWFIALTFIIISIIMSAFIDSLHGTFLLYAVAGMAIVSLASISLTIARNHSFTFTDLFTPVTSPKRVLNFFVLSALFVVPYNAMTSSISLFMLGQQNQDVVISSFGMLLIFVFFVITSYICIRFMFFPFVVVEHENSSLMDLIRMSLDLTKGYFWRIIAFLIAFAVLNVFVVVVSTGLVTLGLTLLASVVEPIGMVAAVSTSLFAIARVYNELKSHSL